MATQIKLRRDTDANWTANSTVVLGEGEIGVNLTNGQFKLGNGTSAWSALTYFQSGAGGSSSISVTTNSASGIGSLSYSSGVLTFTPAASYTLPTATTTVLGGVKVDGTSITINGSGVISGASTYTLPATTTTTLGGVIVPAVGTSGITNTSGTIGLATATTTQLGGVKIDNNTIVISSGVISVGGALTSATIFKGSWDASTNTPALSNSLPAGVSAGWQYIVSVQGTRDIGAGSTAYTVGDLVIYNGTSWSRIPGGNSVTAFNTRQGSITLTSGDVTTALGTQVTKTFFSGPISGADATPTFRTIAATDIPTLTSSQLATILSDETGTGVVVFGTSPAITTSITTASASFDLLNTTATTVNAFGASTATTVGATTGTHTIRNATVTLANATALNVNGASPTVASTSTGTLTLFNTNLLTVNAFNAATTATLVNSATTLGIGNTATAAQTVNMFTASTGASTYNIATGATANTTTKAINIGTAGVSGSTTNIALGSSVSGALGTTTINTALTVTPSATGTVTIGAASGTGTITVGSSTAGQTVAIATGVTASGSTKTINIGTNSASGSTTSITVGSTAGTSTLTFQGLVADATTTSTAKGVGYLGTPINTQAGTYTLVISDVGKTIYAGGNLTIPANGTVAFPIGTIINVIASSAITVAITTDTLQWGGQATSQTGTRSVAIYGMATLIKVTNTIWYISGVGVT